MTNLLQAFNDHFYSFVDDIQLIYPDDVDIMSAKNSVVALRKINPKLVILVWNERIVSQYEDQIMKGDLDFFLNKDYSQDLADNQNNKKIMDAINRLREPIKNMNPSNREKSIKYMQNLTKLCNLYFNK
jgi:hypothetical protein